MEAKRPAAPTPDGAGPVQTLLAEALRIHEEDRSVSGCGGDLGPNS